MRDFLGHYLPLTKGPVLNERGQIIGEHDGAALYTVGERHGFRVTAHTATQTAQYVVSVDTHKNTITVSGNKNDASTRVVRLIDTNWLQPVSGSFVAQARYRETPVACVVEGNTVTFDDPHLAPPGQSLVIYDGDKLIGGGIISS